LTGFGKKLLQPSTISRTEDSWIDITCKEKNLVTLSEFICLLLTNSYRRLGRVAQRVVVATAIWAQKSRSIRAISSESLEFAIDLTKTTGVISRKRLA
jgi:hypothetical protein